MKRILVIGFVLLALLALTGVVSAVTEGKMSVVGDVVPRSLELGTVGGINAWTLLGGENTNNMAMIVVTNNGFAQGYAITVADKMDLDMNNNPKPASTEGHLVPYTYPDYQWNWRWRTGYPTVSLANPLHISIGASDVTLSGEDQVLFSTSSDGQGLPDTYSPAIKQTIVPTDQAASYVGGKGYRIIITVTATPN